jgi:hypothetical protein
METKQHAAHSRESEPRNFKVAIGQDLKRDTG